jgi:hypothetical protein
VTYSNRGFGISSIPEAYINNKSPGDTMIDIIKKIHAAAGSPNLDSHEKADHFTAQVAATLHFGSKSLDITGDPKYGRRKNPSGILSDDVIGIKTGSGASDADYFDYIRGAGASGWAFVWQGSSGGPWVAPDEGDVVGTGSNPGTPDPKPTDPGPAPIDISEIEGQLTEIRIVLGAILQLVDAQNSISERLIGALDRLNETFGKFDKVEGHVNEIKLLLDNQGKIIVAESQALRAQVSDGIRIKLR